MNDPNGDKERDEILFAFHKAYSNPTAEHIIKWVEKYPQYADDIRSHAAVLKDWAARDGMPAMKPDAAMISRGQSRAMDALHKAQTASAAAPVASAALTFDEIMASRGTDVPELSRKLNITRGVLAALVNGRMLPPVGERLVATLTNYWAISREMFEQALQFALATPRLGHAKAEGTPSVIPRSYEDLVRSSSMPDERKRYWLGEEQ